MKDFNLKSHHLSWLAARLLACLAAAGAGTAAWAGYGNAIELKLANGDKRVPVTMTLSFGNCAFYQGPATITVNPGDFYRIGFVHDPASRCNSQSGSLVIGVNGNTRKAYFVFNESGPLWLDTRPPAPPLVGRFSRIGNGSDNGGEFLWESPTMFVLAGVGKPKGRWALVCQQFCDVTIRNEISSSSSTEKTAMQETTKAISVALEAGVEFEAFSAKTSVTASQEQKLGSSMSQMTSTGMLEAREQKIGFTQEQMTALNLFGVWQWTVTTSLNDGSASVFKTTMFTCTPDGESPRYLPGSAQDLAACRAKVASAPPPPAPPTPAPPIPVPAPAPVPAPVPAPAPAAVVSAGTVVSLLGAHGMFVVAEADGRAYANRNAAGSSGRFSMISNTDGSVSFKSAQGRYLVAEGNGTVNANRDAIGPWEKFAMIRNANGTVSFKTAHGKYLVAEPDGRLNANRDQIGAWESFRLQ
jgi:hypothetical protein